MPFSAMPHSAELLFRKKKASSPSGKSDLPVLNDRALVLNNKRLQQLPSTMKNSTSPFKIQLTKLCSYYDNRTTVFFFFFSLISINENC
jgi:hypothetical protein